MAANRLFDISHHCIDLSEGPDSDSFDPIASEPTSRADDFVEVADRLGRSTEEQLMFTQLIQPPRSRSQYVRINLFRAVIRQSRFEFLHSCQPLRKGKA